MVEDLGAIVDFGAVGFVGAFEVVVGWERKSRSSSSSRSLRRSSSSSRSISVGRGWGFGRFGFTSKRDSVF